MFEKFLSLSLKKRICIISSVAVVLAAAITTGVVLAVNNPKEDVVENIPATEQTTQAAVAAEDTAAEETETEEVSTEIVSQIAAGSESSTKIAEEQIAAEEKKQEEAEKEAEKESQSSENSAGNSSSSNGSGSSESSSSSGSSSSSSDSDSSSSSGGYKSEYCDYIFDSKEDHDKLLNSLENYEEKIVDKVISKAVNSVTVEDFCYYANKLLHDGEEVYIAEDDKTWIGEQELVWTYYYAKKGYSTSEMISYVKSVAKDFLSTVKDGDAVVIDVKEDQDWAQIVGDAEDGSSADIAIYIHLSLYNP